MSDRYRQARVAAVMTQEHLAAAAGVSVSTVRRLENGGPASAESRRAVAAVLGIDVSEPLPRKQGTQVETVVLDGQPVYFLNRRATGLVLWCLAFVVAMEVTSAWQWFATGRQEWAFLALYMMPGIVMGPAMGAAEFPRRWWRGSGMLAGLFGTTLISFCCMGVYYAFTPDAAPGFVAVGWVSGLLSAMLWNARHGVVRIGPGTKRIGGSPRQREVSKRAGEGKVVVVVSA